MPVSLDERSHPAPSVAGAVVALGGGHGLEVVLRALRQFEAGITAIVNVADDGGSSGDLRRAFDVPAVGDVRRALLSLAHEGTPARVLGRRFENGELSGHPLGNLFLVGLILELGSFAAAVREFARLVPVDGTILPVTDAAVTLEAETDANGTVAGQSRVAQAAGIERIRLDPRPSANPEGCKAIGEAEKVILSPGSLFTSLLPVLETKGIAAAVGSAPGDVIQICNLSSEHPETAGLDATDHVRAVLATGARVDVLVHDPRCALAVDESELLRVGCRVVEWPVARTDLAVHDPGALAGALNAIAAVG